MNRHVVDRELREEVVSFAIQTDEKREKRGAGEEEGDDVERGTRDEGVRDGTRFEGRRDEKRGKREFMSDKEKREGQRKDVSPRY